MTRWPLGRYCLDTELIIGRRRTVNPPPRLLLNPTHSALQAKRLAVAAERHRLQPVELLAAVVHLGQQAAAVDPHLGLCQGREHRRLYCRVAEAGRPRLGGREDEMDATSADGEAEQRLHGGEDVQAVPVDDSVV